MKLFKLIFLFYFVLQYLLCTTVLVFFSVTINPLCLTFVIKKFHLDRVDDAKVNNMTAVLKDIFKRRER